MVAEAEDSLRYLSKNNILMGVLKVEKSLITVTIALDLNILYLKNSCSWSRLA